MPDVDLRFLVAYDSNANYIATPRTQFLGKNYFSDDVQKFFNYTDTQMTITARFLRASWREAMLSMILEAGKD